MFFLSFQVTDPLGVHLILPLLSDKTSFIMRTFIKSWIPQWLRILRSPCRSFHGNNRLLTSQIVSYYEPINQCKKELPEYFNFASDVLDEWARLEKVVFVFYFIDIVLLTPAGN